MEISFFKMTSATIASIAALLSGMPLHADDGRHATGETRYIEKKVIGEDSRVTYIIRMPEAQQDDKTILSDANELLDETESMLTGLQERTGARLADLEPIQIDWLRKGRMIKTDAEQPVAGKDDSFNDSVDGYVGYAPKHVPTLDSFSAFKPTTLNEFNLFIPAEIRRLLLRDSSTRGLTDSYSGPDRAKSLESVEGSPDATLVPLGWSFNDDNRTRKGSLNTEITTWPWRTITHFSNTCSGTLIGPRHVVTAAHCINGSGTNNFSSLTVRTRRNGTAWLEQSTMPGCPNLNCPDIGETYWYFTPSAWRQANVSNREQYDFGIIVTPDRLGDNVGWMGYWYAPMNSLNTVNKYSRGYPSCNASSNGSPRIDDPADPLMCATCTTDLTICSANHMYGDAASCSVGNGTNPDGDGYNRNFRMSCDGSAGMSGSPLYLYGNGNVGNDGSVYYTAHDIQSTCGATAASSSCANVSRVDRMLRLTPEYSSWISYFRAQFP